MKTRFAVAVIAYLIASLSPIAVESMETKHVLERFRREHASVVYRYGGCSKAEMDCSCFIQRLFRHELGLRLPRTTLEQVRSMRYLRVPAIQHPEDIVEPSLCTGDLIYTYRKGSKSSWYKGPRHVVVYVGDGRVLHSSSALGGVGLSPLSWVRKFELQGVYRPLGC